MKRFALLLALSLAPAALLAHPSAEIAPLMAQDLAGLPGKEGLMLEVTYAPGASDPVHRHDAHVFVYVLEGEIVMQVRGGPETHLKAGQMFYESPTDIHVVGRNASTTAPARFLAFFVKDKGVPPLTPAE